MEMIFHMFVIYINYYKGKTKERKSLVLLLYVNLLTLKLKTYSQVSVLIVAKLFWQSIDSSGEIVISPPPH